MERQGGMGKQGWLGRVRAAFKKTAGRAARMMWTGRGNQGGLYPWQWPLLPGARFDYEREAGDPTANGAVAICLGWIGDNFTEPEMIVEREAPGQELREVVRAHPLASLVANPNPFYDGDALMAATAMSYSAFGNAYWFKARNAAGRVAELWYVPHWQVRPVWRDGGSEFIGGYEYRVDGRVIPWSREDVVHFRFGFDHRNPRLGQSRLWPVLREVVTDNEASTLMAALLRNMGILGVLITPSDGSVVLKDKDADALRQQYRGRFTREAAGEPFVCAAPLKVERLGLTPEELALDKIRNIPEARICAALRIPPMVVNLTVGEPTRTFSNYGQARRAAYEDCLGPMQRRFARTLERQLLPEVGDPRRERIGWDYSRVSALQDDRTELFRQNAIAVHGGWMTVNEARARVGDGGSGHLPRVRVRLPAEDERGPQDRRLHPGHGRDAGRHGPPVGPHRPAAPLPARQAAGPADPYRQRHRSEPPGGEQPLRH